MTESLAPRLKGHSLLTGFSDAAVELVASQCSVRRFDAEEPVFLVGMPSDGMYFVLSGTVKVFVMTSDHESVLGELGPGDTLGELALAAGGTRAANASAVTLAELAFFPLSRFQALTQEKPQACLRLVSRITARFASLVRVLELGEG